MAKYKVRNLEEQRVFMREMALSFSGISKKDSYGRETFKCICPECSHNEANFFTSFNQDTFIFKCHRQKCKLGSMSLHRMITTYGSPEIQDRWLEGEGEWLGIKNRITPGPKKQKSFRESMQLKSECHRIMISSENGNAKLPTSDTPEVSDGEIPNSNAINGIAGVSGMV